MIKKDIFYKSADGETQIHAIRWEPETKPKAILQIIHGMVEFIDRYNDFAEYLVSEGYLVTGEDHLGHGASVQSDEYHGYFGKNGNEWVIADIRHLYEMTRAEYPGIPYMMLGHSMGSFLVRQYITENEAEYAKDLDGVIVMGTGWQPGIAMKAGKLIAKLLGTSRPGKKSRILDAICFGSYLKRIENPNTISDWLTKDEKIVRWYRNTPWCTFPFSPNGYYNMFVAMEKAHDTNRMKKLPLGLPLLFASGAEDPVGAWGEGVRKTYVLYQENSPCTCDIKLYEDDRHEILNEIDRDVVYKDMLQFLDYCISE